MPIYGPEDIPNDFPIAQFWTDITSDLSYGSATAEASILQNPCFWYAQKGPAYTLFSRGDNNGVASQRELFFMYDMAHNEMVNGADSQLTIWEGLLVRPLEAFKWGYDYPDRRIPRLCTYFI